MPTNSVVRFTEAATIPATTSMAAPATRIPAGERGNRGLKEGDRMCAGGISGLRSDGRMVDCMNAGAGEWLRTGSKALGGAAKAGADRAAGFAEAAGAG